MNNESKRYRVRDGYAFQYVVEVVDHTGKKHVFPKLNPALGGSVVELSPLQTGGQEHKLELCEEVTIQCNNSGCGKKFSTTAANATTHGWCPHCGGRGGTLLGAVNDVKPDKVKKTEPEPEPEPKPDDTNRMDTAEDNERDEPEPEPETETEPKLKKAAKRKRK